MVDGNPQNGGGLHEGLGPVTHRFDSQRLRLSYVDWGNPDKPLLLLVHGGKDHARNWDWVAERLRHDWHVVCPDLRGHGDSDWSPDGAYTMEYMACDLANLVSHLGAEHVNIVSHSYGGAISLRYTGLFPEKVRRLAVIEGLAAMEDFRVIHDQPPLSLVDQWRGWIEKRQAMAAQTPRTFATIEEGVERMKKGNSKLSDEQARHLAIWAMRRFESGQYGWKFDPYIQAQQPMDPSDPERRAIWGAITCPVLLFHGKESWAHNPAEDGRAAMFRDARVISMEGAGHWVHHDRLDDFVAAVREFL
ncbi:alpha/beta hydrolase [Sphingobium sufflavum]|uniref:alpha/beta fold hydrolase n=1 Tax=Sphingobium sufflavum TaxID=1129547 RepID=UPI001F1B48DE|nr:alpha/beta hydrolase [Sphingobium sufflavum]MCE7797334.1 alpha/beta hydrolase [Sphingobium sufflavum]